VTPGAPGCARFAAGRSVRGYAWRHEKPFAGTVLAASLGFGLVQLDVSIVNVALVSIGRELHAGTATVAWIVDAYTIAFACALLPGGALGDRIGAKRSFLAGFALFGIASVGCALAPSIGALIALRVVQGIGASTLVPCSLALIAHAAHDDGTPRPRNRPVDRCGRRGTGRRAARRRRFDRNSRLARDLLHQSPAVCGGDRARLTPDRGDRSARRQFDPLGEILAVVTLSAAIAGVIEAGSLGLGATIVRIALVTAILGACAFVLVESRTNDPMVPLVFFSPKDL
jgi:DHA2 family methylenomycin A resistance protein-like MFS transporter